MLHPRADSKAILGPCEDQKERQADQWDRAACVVTYQG